MCGKAIRISSVGVQMTNDIYPAGKRGLRPIHPGEILRDDVIPALGRSIKDIADLLGVSRQHLHAILREEASITVDMALRLGKLCGNGANLWINMQKSYDLTRLEKSMAKELDEIPTLRAAE